jgi:hypothetical protein
MFFKEMPCSNAGRFLFSYAKYTTMYKNRLYKFSLICAAVLAASCNNGGRETTHGPIVLGDSSSIVTETDSQYLRDYVTDFQAKEPVAAAAVTPQPEQQQPAKDTARPVPAAEPVKPEPEEKQVAAPKGNGLNVDYKDINVFIPGITTRTYGHNAVKGNSASFGLTGGKLNGNQLQISGGTVTRVNQRYQTAVVLKNELGTLQLDALSYTSGWEALKGGRNGYYITGLDENRLDHSNANASAIRNAVSRALRSKRLSRKKEQEWLNSIRNVRAVNQKPLSVVLHSVVWQIEGKDARGKSFRKELRIDLPI